MYAILIGESRPTEYTYQTPQQLASLQAKYGDRLKLVGGNTMQPAAPGIVKPTMAQGELPPVKKKPAKSKPGGQATTESSPVKDWQFQPKAVVNITTGAFFLSCIAAAESINTTNTHMSAHLTKNGKVKRKIIKGNVFRYATPQEIERGKAIITKSERVSPPAVQPSLERRINPIPQPVICVTNGIYYPSAYSAAAELKLNQGGLSNHLRPNSPRPHKHIKGYVLRYATPEEIEQHSKVTGRSLPSPVGG